MLKVFWTISFLLISQLSWATNQVIVARSNTGNNTAATTYIAPMCGGGVISNGCGYETTRSLAEGIAPTGGTLGSLAIELDTAPGAGKSWTMTLWVNSASTGITCVISGASAKTCNDIVNTAAITAGQPFTLEIVPAGTPAANSGFRYSMVFNSTTAGESIYVWSPNSDAVGNLITTGNNRRIVPFGSANWQVNDGDRLISPTAGTIKNIYIRTEAAPDNGAGTQTYTFTIRKNNANAATTCAVSESATTCNDISNTIAAVAGDTFSINHISAGTPASTKASGGIVFAATTSGEFIVPVDIASVSSTANVYGSMQKGANNTTESARDSLTGTAFTVKSIYVGLSANTAGGSSLALTLREELTTSTAATCTVGAAASTCNATGLSVAVTANNTYDTLSSPTATPGTPNAWVGYLGFITPPSSASTDYIYGATLYDAKIY